MPVAKLFLVIQSHNSRSVLCSVFPSFDDLARAPTTENIAGPGLGRGHDAAKGAKHSLVFLRSSSRTHSTVILILHPFPVQHDKRHNQLFVTYLR